MKSHTNTVLLILSIIFCITLISCKKYLEKKSNQKLVVPETIQDLQSLLDYYFRVNRFDPSIHEASSDDYYLTTSNFNSLKETDRNSYVWEDKNVFNAGHNDWGYSYDNIYRANLVIDNIDKIQRTPNDENEWENTKGNAYFLRGKCFLQNAIIWALAYDENSANTDMGIPLRTDPDFNKVSTRASVKQTYDQIVSDLKRASELLPTTALHVMRPSKPAAYALLARTYLAMRKYDSAFKYSDLCLQLKSTLLNYNGGNEVDLTKKYPFAPYNVEVLYSCRFFVTALNYASVDTILFNSYSDNDLRKTLLFKNQGSGPMVFKGSYEESGWLFGGPGVDEVYLIRSECYARLNNVPKAMNDLNTLLVNRWKEGTFTPFSASTPEEALKIILSERRKELIFRGIRWMDIKRLNKEGANITLKRILNGQAYILKPNDLKYALPIPEEVIKASGMAQNPR